MEKTNQNFLADNSKSNDNSSKEKHLTFFVDEQLLSIPSSQVVEIIRMQPITFIPKLPHFVIGVINLRGKIVPLINLRLKFNKEPKQYDDYTSIIVTETEEYSVGFIVDRVNDVTDISKNQISDAPKLAKETSGSFISGIATVSEETVMLLDVMKILTDDDLISVTNSSLSS